MAIHRQDYCANGLRNTRHSGISGPVGYVHSGTMMIMAMTSPVTMTHHAFLRACNGVAIIEAALLRLHSIRGHQLEKETKAEW